MSKIVKTFIIIVPILGLWFAILNHTKERFRDGIIYRYQFEALKDLCKDHEGIHAILDKTKYTLSLFKNDCRGLDLFHLVCDDGTRIKVSSKKEKSCNIANIRFKDAEDYDIRIDYDKFMILDGK